MLEKLMAIPDGETLTLKSRTWFMPEFTVEASCEVSNWIGGRKQRGVKLKHNSGLYDRSARIWPTTYLDLFRDFFESVREDPRYAAMEQRIEAMVQLSEEEGT